MQTKSIHFVLNRFDFSVVKIHFFQEIYIQKIFGKDDSPREKQAFFHSIYRRKRRQRYQFVSVYQMVQIVIVRIIPPDKSERRLTLSILDSCRAEFRIRDHPALSKLPDLSAKSIVVPENIVVSRLHIKHNF